MSEYKEIMNRHFNKLKETLEVGMPVSSMSIREITGCSPVAAAELMIKLEQENIINKSIIAEHYTVVRQDKPKPHTVKVEIIPMVANPVPADGKYYLAYNSKTGAVNLVRAYSDHLITLAGAKINYEYFTHWSKTPEV
jgi:hypothetical protein